MIPPKVLRIKRKRNQDPLQALILEERNTKRSKPSTPVSSPRNTPKKSRSIETLNYFFKLQRTDDKVNTLDESIVNSILTESNKNNFIIPKHQIEEDLTIPNELSDLVQSYLSVDQSEIPRRKRSSRKSFSDESKPVLDEYVYDVYIMENEPMTTANHPSSQIGYIKFFNDGSDLINDDEEDNEEPVLSDDEDSNAESFYQNDYPSDEDAEGLETNDFVDDDFNDDDDDDEGYVPYDGTGLKGDEYYDYSELENYQEELQRNEFFKSDKDDPIAIHRDKIFGRLKNMLDQD